MDARIVKLKRQGLAQGISATLVDTSYSTPRAIKAATDRELLGVLRSQQDLDAVRDIFPQVQ